MEKKYVLYVSIKYNEEPVEDEVNIEGFEDGNVRDYEALIDELIWKYRYV